MSGPPRPRSYEEQIYSAIVREGDVIFDVGANVGEVSLFLSRLAGPSGAVVAFEPVWSVYARLCGNVQADRCSKAPTITLPYGLADTVRTGALQIPNGMFELASLAEATRWTEAQHGAHLTESESTFLTVDTFMKDTQHRAPQFMKIDVEGAELLVLRGATRFFADRHRPVMLIELFAPWERAFGYGPWDVLSLLSSLGYQFLFACPEGLIEHAPSRMEPLPPQFENGYNVVAFVLDAHRDRLRSLKPLRVGGRGTRLPMLPPPQPNRVAEPASNSNISFSAQH